MKKNVITSAILLAIPALAAAEDVAKLDVINVYSASATPTSLHQTASSVTVLTEKDFAQRGATYVSDVLKTVPSLAVSTVGWSWHINQCVFTRCGCKPHCSDY